MKKRVILTIMLLSCILMITTIYKPLTKVKSEGEQYACILKDEIYLYSTPDEKSGIFLLPKSYYVKIIANGKDYTRVDYLTDGENRKKISGYCKTNELEFVDYIPRQPYLYLNIELEYTIDNNEIDFNNSKDFLDKLKIDCAYYGDYKIGSKIYSYVYGAGKFGYIPKPKNLKYDKNTEYEEHNKSEISPPEEEPKTGMTAGQTAILVVLCFLIPVVAALIIRQPKKSPYESDE